MKTIDLSQLKTTALNEHMTASARIAFEKRNALLAEATAIRDKARAANRDLTEGEADAIDTRVSAIEAIDAVGRVSRGPSANLYEPLAGNRAAAAAYLNRGWLDSRGNRVPVLAKGERLTDAMVALGRAKADDAGGNLGEYVRAIVTGNWNRAAAFGMTAALSGGSQTDGGFLLTPSMSAQTIDLARNQSVVFAAGAQTVVMDDSELVIAKKTADPTAYWTAENGEITSSQPTFGRLTFRARKLAVLVKVSRELIEDAPNAAAEIEDQISQAMALEIDRAALLGDGGGEEPRGLFNVTGVNTNGSIGSPLWDDFIDAIYECENDNGNATAAIYSPNTAKTLRKLKTGDGSNSAAQYLMAPPSVAALQHLITKQLADSQAVVGDFTKLMVGIRIGGAGAVELSVGEQADTAFAADQVWIRARWRGDVQVSIPAHFSTLTGIS